MPLPEAAPPRPPRALPWPRSAPALPRAPQGARTPMRNPAIEAAPRDEDEDATEAPIERRREERPPDASADLPHRRAVSSGVDADTQTPTGPAEWSSYDLRRSMRLLHSEDEAVVKRTLRRLHIRFWHAAAAKLVEILRLAGAPRSALALVQWIVDTCKICRAWRRPLPCTTDFARVDNPLYEG